MLETEIHEHFRGMPRPSLVVALRRGEKRDELGEARAECGVIPGFESSIEEIEMARPRAAPR